MRDGFRRGKSTGSIGADGEGGGEEEEDGLEDGLERLMGGSDGGGKKQIGMSRWRVQPDGGGGGGLDGEVLDQDTDWTRSKGMIMSRGKGRVQDSDGDEEDSLEKDNLKWPAGEGWKPL